MPKNRAGCWHPMLLSSVAKGWTAGLGWFQSCGMALQDSWLKLGKIYTIAIVGPSGSGKSTVSEILRGVPQSAEMYLPTCEVDTHPFPNQLCQVTELPTLLNANGEITKPEELPPCDLVMLVYRLDMPVDQTTKEWLGSYESWKKAPLLLVGTHAKKRPDRDAVAYQDQYKSVRIDKDLGAQGLELAVAREMRNVRYFGAACSMYDRLHPEIEITEKKIGNGALDH
ncbi:hypothetical protein NQ176_g6777 [Zarea fungicola]|uniref:Uncharacterized protein n=1 Tax=Zarea fungicola TaxID=93591 RepID=A0ACC1N1K4_9HYPO|nr:hypothetical protein NQ176_g6777 [Lecanicillium fungicola]